MKFQKITLSHIEMTDIKCYYNIIIIVEIELLNEQEEIHMPKFLKVIKSNR